MGRYTVRAKDLTWRQVDDEIVILDLASSTYLALNGTGALLWLALAAGTDEPELTDTLTREFAVPREQAAIDVSKFLAHCVGLGILE